MCWRRLVNLASTATKQFHHQRASHHHHHTRQFFKLLPGAPSFQGSSSRKSIFLEDAMRAHWTACFSREAPLTGSDRGPHTNRSRCSISPALPSPALFSRGLHTPAGQSWKRHNVKAELSTQLPSAAFPQQPAEPTAKQNRELHAVNTAVVVNVLIFGAKVAVWMVTRSGSLLAEAVHSMADIGNQLLLRAGVQQSRRMPTRQHPYGYGREKYIFSLMSAVGMFCVGAGAAVVHGVQSILDPPALEHMGYNLAVLAASGFAEMWSLRVALSAIRLGAEEQGQSVLSFLKMGRDPTTAAVFAEDAGAVAGLGIAGLASYMTWLTGDPLYDASGSIAIGVLMGAIAVTLIRNNKRFLIGQAMPADSHASIIQHLKSDPMVLCVIDPKSEELGDGVYRFKAEIQWSGNRVVHKYLKSLGRESLYGQIRESACTPPGVQPNDALRNTMDLAMMEFGRGVIRTVGEEIDRLEEELRVLVPGLLYVDLETDRGRTELSATHSLLDSAVDGVATEQQQDGKVPWPQSEQFSDGTEGPKFGQAPAAGAA